MKTVVVIPARMGSSRFPGKPLVNIAGKTMIQRCWELAKKAKNLAEDAEDRIDEEEDEDEDEDNSDEIDSITAEVGDGESNVTVEYSDGEEDDFTVEEDSEEDIIAEVADELNLDEDEVEDLIEFDYGDIDSIEVRISDDGSLARVFYEGGAERRLRFTATDEDDIISELADELNEDEDDIEDWADFM